MLNLSGICAVTFDVGGTLIEPWPSVGHVYAEVAAEHGVTGLDPEELNCRFALAWRAKVQFEYTRAHWSEVVSRTIYGPDAQVEEVHFFDVLYDRFAEAHAWRIFDDVIPTLESLRKRGLQLAAVSNWDERLRPLMKALQLERHFDYLAISGELGFHKPSAAIFADALQHLSCQPGSVLHVGDGAVEDVQGARAVGMHALLLRRGERSSEPDQIASLAEIERGSDH